MKIILASGSPRRKELMAMAGYEYTIEVSEADENISEKDPSRMVEELSYLKAMAVAAGHLCDEEAVMVLGADTVVAFQGEILGKPVDREDAFRMLRELSGHTHQVYTGVSLIVVNKGKIVKSKKFHECTDVIFREITDEEIHWYLESGEADDKAGAYGIQGKAGIFVRRIEGDYYTVMGLPICRVVTEIAELKKETL